MQLQTLADEAIETLGGVLTATTVLLDRLPAASTAADRDVLIADFDGVIRGLREDLAHYPTRDGQDADALIADAIVRVIRLLETEPAGG